MVTSYRAGESNLILQLSTDGRGTKVVACVAPPGRDPGEPLDLSPWDEDFLMELIRSGGQRMRIRELVARLPTRARKGAREGDPLNRFRASLSRLQSKLVGALKEADFRLAETEKQGDEPFVRLVVALKNAGPLKPARRPPLEDLAALKPHLSAYLKALFSRLGQPPPAVVGRKRDGGLPRLYVNPRFRDGESCTPAEIAYKLLNGTSIQLAGEPGLGKTALLTMVARELAQLALQRLNGPNPIDAVPVVVVGRNWRNPSVLDEASLLSSKLYPQIRTWLGLRHERIVLLIDGSDELSDPAFLSALDGDEFSEEHSPTISRVRALMLTGRLGSHYTFTNGTVDNLVLAEFDAPRAERLLRNLGASDAASNLRARGELARNPLYLTLSMQFTGDIPKPLALPELLAKAAGYLMPKEPQLRAMQELAARELKLPFWSPVDTAATEELEKRKLLDEGVITLHRAIVEYLASGTVIEAIRSNALRDDQLAEVVAKLSANGIACLWSRLCNSGGLFWVFAARLYSQLRVQQYMYDVKGLAGLLEQFVQLEQQVERAPPRAQVVFLKLLAHAAYDMKSSPAERQKSIEVFSRLLVALEDHQADLCRDDAGRLPFAWYQAFARDHRLHLGGEGELPVLCEELQAGAPVTSELGRYLVLRAAHYYGHRGNRVLNSRSLQRSTESLEAGIIHFRRALAYRVYALSASFPHAERLRVEVCGLVSGLLEAEQQWCLERPAPSEQDATSESFLTEEQAVGDLANQVLGIGYLECWRYVDGDEAALLRARKACDVGRSLWRIALRVPSNSTVVRYLLNLGGLSAGIALLGGAPAAGLLDAEITRVRADFRAPDLEDLAALASMQVTIDGLERARRKPPPAFA